jgi:hypothetical protein
MLDILYYAIIVGIVAAPTVAAAQLIIARFWRKG